MIYFRDNGELREKYEINYDKKELEELKKAITKNCGEQSIIKKECKEYQIPRQGSYNKERDNNLYHYYDEIRYGLSGNKGTEWDQYEEYEVDLYNCQYKDYICPPLVSFIMKMYYEDGKTIEAIFNRDFDKVNHFPRVKEKIISLQEEIANTSQEYLIDRKKIVDELSKNYEELTHNDEDIEARIKNLNTWTSKMKKELLKMDKKHVDKMKDLNDKLKYLLSIEELNEKQEDVSKYIDELLNLVDIKLIDTIRLEEIERVRLFNSREISEKEMKLIMKNK